MKEIGEEQNLQDHHCILIEIALEESLQERRYPWMRAPPKNQYVEYMKEI